MSDRIAAHRPPTTRNLPARARRLTIGAAAAIPALLIGVLASTGAGAPKDSGLVACAYPLTTHARVVIRAGPPGAPQREVRL